MKIRTALSGIAALLLVGTFYSFAFCMVEDVDDAPISMDYYYSTETDADSGERIGEATSAFIPSEDDTAAAQAMAGDENSIVTALSNEILDFSAGKLAAATTVPKNDGDGEISPDSYGVGADGEEGYDDGEANAETDDVYADNSPSNRLLSKLDIENKPAETTVPLEEELSDDDDVTETATEIIEPDEGDSGFAPTYTTVPDITTIQPVPAADVVITIIDNNSETVETTVTTTTPANAEDISTSETLTVKYGGTTHTENAFDLVCRIVNNEVSSYFNDEAIKAQAVAAYSYVKYHNVNGLSPSVLVRDNPPQRIVDMVSSVWGKCCYYNGKVAQTVYMASSSGYTASSSNVWGGSFAYLTSVACPFDADSDPNYGLTTKFSESAIKTALEGYLGITLSDNPENWIVVSGYVDGNYVSQVTIDGQKTISGRKLRENVLSYQLKSASFDVKYSDGNFIFTTYGWGHGVGMSQNGANILAKMGYTYDQILKYYFTGIDVL